MNYISKELNTVADFTASAGRPCGGNAGLEEGAHSAVSTEASGAAARAVGAAGPAEAAEPEARPLRTRTVAVASAVASLLSRVTVLPLSLPRAGPATANVNTQP